MAKTLVYLQEKGLTDFSELEKSCEEASGKFNALTERSRAISARKKEISELQRNIGTYSKTAPGFTGGWGRQPPTSCAGYTPEHCLPRTHSR
jgi:hypothetical protein